MRGIILLCGLSLLCWAACSPSPQVQCQAGETKTCTCYDLQGTQTCKSDGSGFDSCRCAPGTEKAAERVTTEQGAEGTTPDEPAASPDEPAATPDEPTVADDAPDAAPDTPDATPDAPDDGATDETAPEPPPEPVSCSADEFSYQNKCYKVSDFCEGKIQVPGFPAFTQDAQAAMQQPYKIEFDAISKKPIFCQTKDSYYYLPGTGYGECDKDKDGWINIEAYRAVTSTDSKIQSNARCTLNKFAYIVYHAEGLRAQVKKLDATAAMVETFRNDGGGKLIELPIYAKGQAALPKAVATNCTADTDCTGKVCYLGHCLEGRRFEPAEINTLTKGCIAGLDLNDNKLDDANESPGDTPDPAGEFKPLLTAGYFVELHYGHFQKDYDDNGTRRAVYHIYERDRNKAPGAQGLALKCEQKTDAFLPDYWKKCKLKDNQRCEDPNDPTKTKPGLTRCWLKGTTRLIPSLFKCTVFDNAPDKTRIEGHFHPDNYGFSNKYNRTICSFKAKRNENDSTKRDIEFECSADDGTRKPDPTKKEIGWACVSFQPYSGSAGYIGGCVDQKAEEVCGTTKDGETVTYATHEKDSYGFVRAYAPCGSVGSQGSCSKARRVCSGGTWLACDKCDNCPQNTAGQKATCPSGTWPADSCKLASGPQPETCNGHDDDCDGAIDNGLATTNYYKDEDGDKYGDKNGTPIAKCPAQKPNGYVDNNRDCDDKEANINPNKTEVCDGKDNDCDGSVDEGITQLDFYKDDDKDGFRGPLAFKGCYQADSNKTKICKGTNDCVSATYGTNGETYMIKGTKDADCCDTNAEANPDQTKYFDTAYTCDGKTSFDYNCNGKEDKEIGTCQCSKSVTYQTVGWSMCSVAIRGNPVYDKLWTGSMAMTPASCIATTLTGWKTLCTKTLTNPNALNSCLIDVKHTFHATGNHSESSAGGTYTCTPTDGTLANEFSNQNASNAYSPQYSASGGTPYKYLVFATQGWVPANNKCGFYTNGSATKCGSTGVSVLSTANALPAPSYRFDKKWCTKDLNFGFVGECRRIHVVEYTKAGYLYFSDGTKVPGQTIKCR